MAQYRVEWKYTRFEESNLNNANTCWKFVPPRLPHICVIWETRIKLVKYNLKSVIGEASLTYEQLCTTLTHIESILNSRPMYQLSSDPAVLNPIILAHFLKLLTILVSRPERNE